MKPIFYTISFLLFATTILCQKKAYVIYNSKGKKVSYKRMMKDISKKDVVFFGELHNNPIAHWLQYEVTTDLSKDRDLIMGAEMFEADDQLILNDYLSNIITSEELDSLARLWPNYKTDYAPLVNIAKEKGIPFIATNIPRRYANLVYKNGFEVLDTLPADEKKWIAPLPIAFESELPTYKNILTMMGDHGTPELVMAQAMKDATMAHFISINYKVNHLFIHYNGAYHTKNREGIMWYLNRFQSDLKCTSISTVTQDNVCKLMEENHDIADYIICVDENMTTTY